MCMTAASPLPRPNADAKFMNVVESAWPTRRTLLFSRLSQNAPRRQEKYTFFRIAFVAKPGNYFLST